VTAAVERVADDLNRALHRHLERDQRVYHLGEDIADPYGGAFRITRGLSRRFPNRVLSTPVSESAIMGVAAGLALRGDRVIVEVMFGDFLALAFDPLLNLVTKSVAMYGRRVPMRVLVRCPVGGNRGYGPTHSQSPQKHLIGIPHLRLYELSPFHPAEHLLTHVWDTGEPSVLVEDKCLYAAPVHRDGRVDDGFAVAEVGYEPGVAHVYPVDGRPPDLVILAGGGMVGRTLDAARRLHAEDRISVHLVIPVRLYPVDLDPVLHLIERCGRVAVVEEATAGGTWGTEVAHRLHVQLWGRLREPVLLVSSRDSVIPAAPHLERSVLVQAGTIVAAVRAALGRDGAAVPPTAPPTPPAAGPGTPITVPKLNSNDVTYQLVEWLCDEGQRVAPDTPVVVVETSKAQIDLTAGAEGVLHRDLPAGSRCGISDVLGRVVPAR
jgi:pyruvate/2-oxoglutarate/acetoin dehydrogenase E1 component